MSHSESGRENNEEGKRTTENLDEQCKTNVQESSIGDTAREKEMKHEERDKGKPKQWKTCTMREEREKRSKARLNGK